MICYSFPEPTYFIFVPDLSILYYSHLPATILALVVGIFVYFSGRKFLLNQLLFLITLSFALWNIINLIAWTNIHSDFILFSWSFFGILSALISIFSIYFVYVFLEKKDVTLRVKGIFLALLAPVIVLAPTVHTLSGFNITECDAFGFENLTYEAYYSSLGGIAIIWIFALLVKHYRRAARDFKKQILLVGVGIELFLLSFFVTTFVATYFSNIGVLESSELESYGLFGMIIFMVYIGILLVRFKTFRVSLIASQALIVALLVLIGAQFTYARSTTSLLLNAVALILTAAIGIVLIRSVKREIKQREHIETLVGELEKANKQQIVLLHFITHQIKGFVTKSKNIFASLLDGDLGKIPDEARPFVEEGLRSDTKGVETIQEILNAANIQSGKVSYTMSPISLHELTTDIVRDLKPNADAKGLALRIIVSEGDFTIQGDRMQLTNAIKNLIDNSIKYTPKGSVDISLVREKEKIRLVVKDTGVGITPEDMGVLFTEGGHGKESSKVNVESTGFGLYIVKNIIEAHHGTVWAESEGVNKGSRFTVELPIG